MKNENLIYGIGAVLIIVGAIMKIFHLPYASFGDLIFKIAFGGIFIYMAIHNNRLKKKIKELEG